MYDYCASECACERGISADTIRVEYAFIKIKIETDMLKRMASGCCCVVEVSAPHVLLLIRCCKDDEELFSLR